MKVLSKIKNIYILCGVLLPQQINFALMMGAISIYYKHFTLFSALVSLHLSFSLTNEPNQASLGDAYDYTHMRSHACREN